MHERPPDSDDTARTVRLDVRQLPLWQRHSMIFAAFDGLEPGDALVLVNDHEPRPLRLQLEELRPGTFTWSPVNLGNDRWETEIRRLPNPAGDVAGDAAIDAVLRRSVVLAHAEPATRALLSGHAAVKHLKRGETLVLQGDAWPHVGIVGAGALAIVAVSANGREHLLFEVLPLETIGEMSALDHGVMIGTATVISPASWVVLLPRTVFERALADDPSVARACALVCAQRSRLLAERLTAQVAQTTVARIAAAILPYAPPERGLNAPLPPLDTLTVAHLAIAAGTVREVVSRTLVLLERAGAVERRGGRIARVDREALLRFL